MISYCVVCKGILQTNERVMVMQEAELRAPAQNEFKHALPPFSAVKSGTYIAHYGCIVKE